MDNVKARVRQNYSPNTKAPAQNRRFKNRGIVGLALSIVLPPVGVAFLWRNGVFRTRGRIVITVLSTIILAFMFSPFIATEKVVSTIAPTPTSPYRARIQASSEAANALSNLEELIAGNYVPVQTEDDALAQAEAERAQIEAENAVIYETIVYSVYGDDARLYHADTVCGTQSNRRELTVREAVYKGLAACPDCDPPVPR